MKIKVTSWTKYNDRKDVKFPSWFRIDYKMGMSSKIWGLTGDEYKAWMSVLSLCCMKNSAVIEIEPEWFERVFNVKIKAVESMIQKLQGDQIDPVDVTDAVRERDVDGTCAIRDRQTDRQTYTSASPPEAEGSDGKNGFEEFWQSYPRRHEPNPRKKSLQIFTKLSTDDQAKVLVATKNYTRHCHADGKFGTKFVMQSTTFLNGRWLDWVETKLPGASASSVPEISPHGIPDEKDLPIQTEEERAAAIKEFFDKVRVMCPPTEEKVPNGE